MTAGFQIYGVILTERRTPKVRDIALALLTKAHRHLSVTLDSEHGSATPVSQMIRAINMLDQNTKDCFGQPTGFAINYEPNRAVVYDLDGTALRIEPHEIKVPSPAAGSGLRIKGRKVPGIVVKD